MTDIGSLLAPLGVGIAAAVVLILLALPLIVLVHAAFLLLGATIAGIEGRSYGRSLIVVLLGLIPGFIAGIVLGWVPMIGWLLSFAAGFLITAAIMVPIFKTTFGKGLVAALLSWVFSLIVLGLIGLAVIAGLAAAGVFTGLA